MRNALLRETRGAIRGSREGRATIGHRHMTSDETTNSPASRGADLAASADAVRVAVVRHEVDDGHLDLFVGPAAAVGAGADPDARVVRSWRLPLAAWDAASEGLACGRFAATETEAHRAEYLTLAEPRELSGGRGRVVPLARGAGVARDELVVTALGRELRLARSGVGAWAVEITTVAEGAGKGAGKGQA